MDTGGRPAAPSRAGWWQRVLVLVATAGGVALTTSLGLWQMDRAAQKQAIHDEMQQRQGLPALTTEALPCLEADWTAQSYRPVRVQGQWLNHHTVFLDNRPMDGRAGFIVLTPLRLQPLNRPPACAAPVVLVQRGWVPRDPRDRMRVPIWPAQTDTVVLQARLAPAPSRLFELGTDADVERGAVRQNVQLQALAQEWGYRLAPGSLQQMGPEVPAAAEAPHVRRHWWQPSAEVGKHHAYAAQWFAMAAVMVGLYVWFQWWRPRRSHLSQQMA